jgi:hypothetical protein
MSLPVTARSISRTVWEQLQEGATTAAVLAVFERACALLTCKQHVVALVLPQVGDGPLQVVLNALPSDLTGLKPGMPCVLKARGLSVGGLDVSLQGATVWEPRPDWHALRAQRERCLARLPLVQALSLQHATESSLLSILDAPDPTASVMSSTGSASVFMPIRGATKALHRGWTGDLSLLRHGAAQLAGLGGGLTPAGDDFLCGLMMGAWWTHDDASAISRVLAEAAAPRTTALSAAFLRAAARGECSAAWHSLLAALADGSELVLSRAVQRVLSYGATSGADALAGFLWAGRNPQM